MTSNSSSNVWNNDIESPEFTHPTRSRCNSLSLDLDFENDEMDIDIFSESGSVNFDNYPCNPEFADSRTALPSPLPRNDFLLVSLTGNEIFFIAGDSQLQKEAMVKKFSNVKKVAPAFLYLKYYVKIAKENQGQAKGRKAYVGPTVKPHKDKVTFIPVTREFKWIEVVIEINIDDAASLFGIELGVTGFKDGDYFFVEKLALIHSRKCPTFEEVWELFTPGSESQPETEVDLESQEIAIINGGRCSKIMRCILFPFALLLNCILWPLICCCNCFCPPGTDDEKHEPERARGGYQSISH